jgi:tetratricopeptide (TPR) repeat protein
MSTSKKDETKPMKTTPGAETTPSAAGSSDSTGTTVPRKARVKKTEQSAPVDEGVSEKPLSIDELSALVKESHRPADKAAKKTKKGIVLVDVGEAIFSIDLDRNSPAKINKAIKAGNLHKLAVRPRRGGWIAIGIAVFLLLGIAGSAIGYGAAIAARQKAELNQRLVKATTQFMLSQSDIQNNDLAMAKTRLEYVLQIYPNYPDAMNQLTAVMVELAKTNPEAAIESSAATAIPTVDTGNLENLFKKSQELLANQDWENLLANVDALRNTDPTYKSVQVDGMYYMALRNVGIKRISAGHLEVGIFYLTLAGQIGPIDNEAKGYMNNAVMYLNAVSGFGVYWERTVAGLQSLYDMGLYIIDVNGVTLTQRYAEALAGYGDYLQSQGEWCEAVKQYEASLNIMQLESVNAIIEDARNYCANPPATATPTLAPGETPTGKKKK